MEYGIIGDSFGTELPQTQVPEQDLADEKRKAKFSKTKEFQILKDHLESRIKYYQGFLPDGRSVLEAPVSVEDWKVANAIIAEMQAVIQAYEQAKETLKEYGQQVR